MTISNGRQNLLKLGERGAILVLAGLMSVASVLISVRPQIASAAQVANRSVVVSTSQSAATGVTYDFTFDTLTTETVGGVIFQFCTTPLGACTLPDSMDISGATIDEQSSWSSSFTKTTGPVTTNDCVLAGDNTDTQVCLTRAASSETAATDESITLGAIVNPTLSTPNWMTVFVRIFIYNNANYTPGANNANIVHYGTVAAGIVNQLTTTGRVQERLEFCVASIGDAIVSNDLPVSCDNVSNASAGVQNWPTTTTVDLGIIDNTTVKAAPVDNSVTDPANDEYGVLNVNTNASAGVVVTYFPEALSGGQVLSSDTDQLRSFRVIPTDCADNSGGGIFTDQCFENADRTLTEGEIIASGTEKFGLAIACINNEDPANVANGGIGLTNSFDPAGSAGGTVNDAYDGDESLTDDGAGVGDCENEDISAYSWAFGFDGTTPDTLVASNTVVDNEIIKLRFGAAAAATTPTGTYSVTTTYIATATY